MPTSVSQYIFGNSLVNFAGGSGETNILVWLDQLAEEAGNTYAATGGYGFLRNFADRPEPLDSWGFPGVTDSWDGDTETFAQAGFNSVLITPANFIQYQGPDADYAFDTRSPLDAVNEIVADVRADYPSADVLIYEGWADMGPFAATVPPSANAEAAYYAYTSGDYHDWFVDLIDAANAANPDANLLLVPVAPVLADLFTGTLADIPVDDLFVDNAPHGTETTYFLASLITYSAIYGEPAPDTFTVPANIHLLVASNYAALTTEIHAAVETYQAEVGGGVGADPNSDPMVVDDAFEMFTDTTSEILVLANDSDPDGDPLTITSVSVAGSGMAEVVGEFIYFTADGTTGTSEVTYTVSDGNGGTATGTLTMTVVAPDPTPPAPPPVPEPDMVDDPDPMIDPGENTLPEAMPDDIIVPLGQTVWLDVLDNDTDGNGDPLTIQAIAQPVLGSAELIDGRIEYVAPATGVSDVLSYSVSDGRGGFDQTDIFITLDNGVAGAPEEAGAEPDPVMVADDEAGPAGFDASFFALSSDVQGLGDVDFSVTPDATDMVSTLSFLDQTGALWEGGPTDYFAARFAQEVDVEEAGVYRFLLYADDGVRLSVDGTTVVGHEETGEQQLIVGEVFLERGLHEVEVDYFERTGEQSLYLEWIAPDGADLMDSLARPDGQTLETLAGESAEDVTDDVFA
ncbi:Ig-like domain-containing protein [Pseudaestuariivita atlantica]|uniref:Ig-like domain-containing protein n=1 Tax=Pseudaestuariivita atlantica TaxID=1317121 RepID=UPI00067C55E9|nr:Ig-like domain-containing protein [Pseudaestuariivita atlantica]